MQIKKESLTDFSLWVKVADDRTTPVLRKEDPTLELMKRILYTDFFLI
jgi:hypothetical protein